MPRRHALHVRLVDDGFMPRAVGAGLAGRGAVADHHAFRHEAGAVRLALDQIRALGANLIAEQAVVPDQLSRVVAGIRIEQELVAIESVAVLRCVGPMHAVAVVLARREARHIAVPNLVGVFGQGDARRLRAGLVEQAEIHAGRVRGEQRKVDAAAVRGGAEWPWVPRIELHRRQSSSSSAVPSMGSTNSRAARNGIGKSTGRFAPSYRISWNSLSARNSGSSSPPARCDPLAESSRAMP